MSLGKVDELGRFVSELDPQPELEKTKSRSLPFTICVVYEKYVVTIYNLFFFFFTLLEL